MLLLLIATTSCPAQLASLQATMTLRTVDGVTIPFQNGIPAPSFEKQTRMTINLGGTWRKQRFAAADNITLAKRDSAGYAALVAEAAGRNLPTFNDSTWASTLVPGVENTLRGYEKTPEFYEDGVWYRRHFAVDDSVSLSSAMLVFYAVNYVADVWLNDQYLGYHEGGYTPFAFDVSGALLKGSDNVLIVRVDNPQWGVRNDIVPFYKVDWFNYTGIIHDVYLEFADTASVVRADVVPLDTAGTVRVTSVLRNSGVHDVAAEAIVEVFNPDVDDPKLRSERPADLIGSPVAVTGQSTFTASIPADSTRAWRTYLTIPSPRLWSPGTPNFYILRVSLRRNGVIVDSRSTQFGVRTVRTDGHRFLLNGRPKFFAGAARHEDHPAYGRSVPTSIIYNDLEKIRSTNIAFVRTAHYPNHPYTYLVADRLGLAIMEEIPVWWFDTATPWLIQNTLRHIHQQMWREMIFRDFNRPSILLWSTCNECKEVTNRQSFIQTVHEELDTQYPDGRLVTQSAAADRPGPWDPSQAACDVAGWTLYFGIFHGGTYYQGTKDFLAEAHRTFPNKPILDTEFGFWSGENGFYTTQQVTVFDSTFPALAEVSLTDTSGAERPSGFLLGSMWWCAFDWYTAGSTNGWQSMGLYHMNRVDTKPVANHLRAAYYPYFQHAGTVTGIETAEDNALPVQLSLGNYPNPFNPATVVRYHLPASGLAGLPVVSNVRLVVYDLLGREAAVLVDEEKPAGEYEVTFDGTGLASGVYLCRLVSGGQTMIQKMLLIR